MLKIHAIRKSSQLFIGLILFFSLVLAATWYIASATATKNLYEEAHDFLAVFTNDLSGEVDKFKTIPSLLALHPALIRAASTPQDRTAVAKANELLEKFNRISNSIDTYVTDSNGLTVASSNWSSANSFIGEDLGFRPYVNDAIKHGTGYYFALGDTSRRRGFYYSSVILENQHPVGVVVVKVDMDSLERTWSRGKGSILVSDEDGVIFISTKHDWVFRTIAPLSAARLKKIQSSRRYADMLLTPLDIREVKTTASGDELWTLYDQNSGSKLKLMQQSISVPEKGWVIHTLSDLSVVSNYALQQTLLVFLLTSLSIAVLSIFLIDQRNRQHQSNLRRATYGVMEQQVKKRTRQLSTTNKRLQQEVAERLQAEKDLTAAQENLVQAAKMAALGKMATSITHELSQPLAAIRAFADNAQEYIRRGKLEHTDQNLVLIVKMGNRMSEIMRNLKTFARKTPLRVENIALGYVVEQTLEMMNPALQQAAVTVNLDQIPADLHVRAEAVRLQQVFTNLLHNSIDAIRDAEQPVITISCFTDRNTVTVTIADNGVGMSDEIKDKLFEPFSTSKKSGEGLGLGLSLSRRIVQEFGGELDNVADKHSGAEFTVKLLLANDESPRKNTQLPITGSPAYKPLDSHEQSEIQA